MKKQNLFNENVTRLLWFMACQQYKDYWIFLTLFDSLNTIHWNIKLFVQGDRIASSAKKAFYGCRKYFGCFSKHMKRGSGFVDVLFSFNAFVGVLTSHVKLSKKIF